jgi:hypothetical protein
VEWLLTAERQDLLELLADSNDAEVRDQSRAVAKWIKNLMGPVKEYIIDLEKADREPVPEGDPEAYMDFDSDSQERPSSSGGVPSGT